MIIELNMIFFKINIYIILENFKEHFNKYKNFKFKYFKQNFYIFYIKCLNIFNINF